jgi:hypothetical protein
MTGPVLSDDQIQSLSPHDRQELIWRLARPRDDLLPSPGALPRLRRRRLTVLIGSTVALVPWTVYLGLTLPDRHVARNWSVTWVGFDALLVATFALTAVLGLLRRQLLILAAFTSGLLLLCDAWFDVTTAGPGEIWQSTGAAAVLELPIAVLLISSALRLVRLTAARLWLVQPGTRLWQVPLLYADPDGPADPVGPVPHR